MQFHSDSTSHIEQPRSARMEQRSKPHVKETIQRAAVTTHRRMIRDRE